jgi:hypothetical protein
MGHSLKHNFQKHKKFVETQQNHKDKQNVET